MYLSRTGIQAVADKLAHYLSKIRERNAGPQLADNGTRQASYLPHPSLLSLPIPPVFPESSAAAPLSSKFLQSPFLFYRQHQTIFWSAPVTSSDGHAKSLLLTSSSELRFRKKKNLIGILRFRGQRDSHHPEIASPSLLPFHPALRFSCTELGGTHVSCLRARPLMQNPVKKNKRPSRKGLAPFGGSRRWVPRSLGGLYMT